MSETSTNAPFLATYSAPFSYTFVSFIWLNVLLLCGLAVLISSAFLFYFFVFRVRSQSTILQKGFVTTLMDCAKPVRSAGLMSTYSE